MNKKEKKEIKSKIEYATNEIQRLIEVVNYLPVGFPLLCLWLEEGRQINLLQAKGINNPNVVINDSNEYLNSAGLKREEVVSVPKLLEVCLKDTPQKFQDYLEKQLDPEIYAFHTDPRVQQINKIRLLRDEYNKFYELYRLMNRITEAFDLDRKRSKRGSENMGDHLIRLSIGEIVLDAQGAPSGIIGLLGWFDRSRLRKCEICRKIFWAARKDKETCSPKCLNALIHRNYRKNHSKEVNRQRRENYKNRKEGKVK